ncbi:MAG: hypothetical protein Q4B85_14170, partial [Lachnospiraceae bacterium]|nr:hypothetical protein [Lachnospiraceae bacterium]
MKKRFLSKLLALAISAAMVSSGCMYHALPVSAEEAAETQQVSELLENGGEGTMNASEDISGDSTGNNIGETTGNTPGNITEDNTVSDDATPGRDQTEEIPDNPEESDSTKEDPSDAMADEEQDSLVEEPNDEIQPEDEMLEEDEAEEPEDSTSAASFALSDSAVWDGESMSAPPTDSNGVYLIGNGAQLKWFENEVNINGRETINGRLTGDIDLGNHEWTPIGALLVGVNGETVPRYYSGRFDGGNYTIRNLYISSSVLVAGLFGALREGEIDNLNVEGKIEGDAFYMGGIVGHNDGINPADSSDGQLHLSAIANCTNRVTINGRFCIGGIAGYSRNTIMIDCSNSGEIGGADRLSTYAGGIVGSAASGTNISRSKNTGKITGIIAGGIIGGVSDINSGTSPVSIQNCYSAAYISGQRYVGGLAGDINGNKIVNSYSAGMTKFVGDNDHQGRDALFNDTKGGAFYEHTYYSFGLFGMEQSKYGTGCFMDKMMNSVDIMGFKSVCNSMPMLEREKGTVHAFGISKSYPGYKGRICSKCGGMRKIWDDERL